MVEKYIQHFSADEIKPNIQAAWKVHKQRMYEGKEPSYSLPKLITVGKFGIYSIVVRASVSDGVWSYDGGIQSGGSANRQGGFNSVQAVIDWAIEQATKEYIEFYEKNPDCK